MHRRSFVRRVGFGLGAQFLAPLMSSLLREAEGAAARQRFVLYNTANSLQLRLVRTSKVRSETDFDLAPFLAPLAPHGKRLLVVEQLRCSTGVYQHGNGADALACGGGISFDQVIAKTLSANDRFASLAFGIPGHHYPNDCSGGTILTGGKGAPVFPDFSPLLAYDRIFGGGAAPEDAEAARVAEAAARRKLALDQSYLDAVRTDAQKMLAALPASQRPKAEQLLESIRAFEKRMGTTARASGCVVPQKPSNKAFPTDSYPNNEVDGVMDVLWRAQCDLAVAALSCGMTHVVDLMHSVACQWIPYPFLGIDEGHHGVCHDVDDNGWPAELVAKLEKILKYHAETIAYVYGKLALVSDGDKTLADNTTIVWMSDGGGQHHNGDTSYPFVVVGDAGGALRSGRYVRLEPGRYPVAQMHCTVMNAVGVPTTTFGDGTDKCPGPLSQLLA